MRGFLLVQVLFFIGVLELGCADYISNWTCVVLETKDIPQPSSGITWTRLNCSGYGQESSWLPPFDPEWQAGPMIFNVIQVSLSAPGVQLTGGMADPKTPYMLQPLPDMAKNVPNAIAGVNGGYFFRLDKSSFIDDVCLFKTQADAKQPPSEDDYNYGVGDSLLIINSTLYAHNCELLGYEAPVALIMDGEASAIQVLPWGGQLDPQKYANVIAAGPRIVMTDESGTQVKIPDNDFNVNIWEHAANTAVGLVPDPQRPGLFSTLVMATADGTDDCSSDDPTCGIAAQPMGYFMKDFLKVSDAMGMDQGGSTTCWVLGEGKNGVVSNSDNRNPNSSPRPLFDGLFVTFNK